jgi:S-adenosylmethionine:tRNA ribosyltransferase-isomerase
MDYKLSDFDFKLPDGLIATHPAEPRDSSRLLVLDKKTGKIEHKHFFDIVDYLNAGDILVLNNSKVIPARLMARKRQNPLQEALPGQGGGKVEVLLHKKLNENTWQCLIGGKVKENLQLSFRIKTAAAEVEEPLKALNIPRGSFDSADAPLRMTKVILSAELLKNNQDGTWDVKFNKSGTTLMEAIEKIGEMPLPPYIVKQRKKTLSFRAATGGEEPLKYSKDLKGSFDSADAPLKMTKMDDKDDYQTVFADDKKAGSVAAPTAGLHFTPELLQKIKNKGVKILEITLYVGMGTFAPVKVEDFTKHIRCTRNGWKLIGA